VSIGLASISGGWLYARLFCPLFALRLRLYGIGSLFVGILQVTARLAAGRGRAGHAALSVCCVLAALWLCVRLVELCACSSLWSCWPRCALGRAPGRAGCAVRLRLVVWLCLVELAALLACACAWSSWPRLVELAALWPRCAPGRAGRARALVELAALWRVRAPGRVARRAVAVAALAVQEKSLRVISRRGLFPGISL
jgi:hypothetical protein